MCPMDWQIESALFSNVYILLVCVIQVTGASSLSVSTKQNITCYCLNCQTDVSASNVN